MQKNNKTTDTWIGNKKVLILAMLAGGVASVSPSYAADQSSVEALENEIKAQRLVLDAQQLKLEQLEESVGESSNPKNQVKGSLMIPGTKTSIKIGGWIKATAIKDINNRSDDFVSWNEIPLDGPGKPADGHFRLHARDTRVNILTKSHLDNGGKLKTFFELDFFEGGPGEFNAEQRLNNSFAPRMRHAFGELSTGSSKFLAGQTWTNFMDIKSLSERVDFSSSPGSNFGRQTQLRYTRVIAKGNEFSVALENPESDFNIAPGVPGGPPRNAGKENDRYPDVTVRWQQSKPWGRLALSGVVRELNLEDPSTGEKDSEIGWGLAANGVYKLGSMDKVKFQVSFGDGIGRYIKELEGQSATYHSGGLSANEALGAVINYQHKWNPNWRSNLVFGHAEVDNHESLSATDANKQIQSFHINTFWSPVKPVDVGLEYLYGKRKVENGREGELERVVFAVKFKF
ncbi:MAG: DcaP family trimeric outer membrane transporter [Halopseudomonas sp.]